MQQADKKELQTKTTTFSFDFKQLISVMLSTQNNNQLKSLSRFHCSSLRSRGDLQLSINLLKAKKKNRKKRQTKNYIKCCYKTVSNELKPKRNR